MNSPKKKNGAVVALVVFLVVLVLLFFIGLYAYWTVSIQIKRLESIQKDYSQMTSALQVQDWKRAETEYRSITKSLGKIRTSLNDPFWRFVGVFPVIRTEMDAARTALELYALADRDIGAPLFKLLQDYPIDSLWDEEGAIQLALFQHYTEYLKNAIPCASEITAKARDLDLGKLGTYGSMQTYINDADDLVQALNDVDWSGLDRLAEQAQSSSLFHLSGPLLKFATVNVPKINHVYQVLKGGSFYPYFLDTQIGQQVDSVLSRFEGKSIPEILISFLGSAAMNVFSN